MKDIMLKWHGPPMPDLEPQIVSELRGLLEDGLSEASDLIFHHVPIDDLDGPVVQIWGEERDSAFHCKFQKAMSDSLKIDIEDFKDASWYETIKKRWEKLG